MSDGIGGIRVHGDVPNQEDQIRLHPSIYQLCFLFLVSVAVLAAFVDLLAFEKALLLTLWYIALAISGSGDDR